jgi:predicted Rossmann fold nucleotide-binding protein DprA/Smf involved in DNA uptake
MKVNSVSLKQHLPFLKSDNELSDIAQSLGNLEIFRQQKLAFFCSVRCPGSLIIQTYDFFQALPDKEIAVMSGSSPIEQECLTILLHRKHNIIICPARSLNKMRIRSAYRELLDQGRLLFLSLFTGTQNRPTAQISYERNRFVAILADSILVAYAAPSSKTKQLCQEIINWQKPVYTFENDSNQHLVLIEVKFLESNKI